MEKDELLKLATDLALIYLNAHPEHLKHDAHTVGDTVDIFTEARYNFYLALQKKTDEGEWSYGN